MQVPTTYSCDPFAVRSAEYGSNGNIVTGITPGIPMPTSLGEELTVTISYTINDGPVQTKELTFNSSAAPKNYSSTDFYWKGICYEPTEYSNVDIGALLPQPLDYVNMIYISVYDEDAYISKIQCVSLSINGEPVTPRSN